MIDVDLRSFIYIQQEMIKNFITSKYYLKRPTWPTSKMKQHHIVGISYFHDLKFNMKSAESKLYQFVDHIYNANRNLKH